MEAEEYVVPIYEAIQAWNKLNVDMIFSSFSVRRDIPRSTKWVILEKNYKEHKLYKAINNFCKSITFQRWYRWVTRELE